MTYLNKEQFEQKEQGGKHIVILTAKWCGPCRMMTPMLEVVEKLHPDISVSKVDIEVEQDITQRLNVTSVPTMLLYNEGELRLRHVGATSQRVVEGWIMEHLS